MIFLPKLPQTIYIIFLSFPTKWNKLVSAWVEDIFSFIPIHINVCKNSRYRFSNCQTVCLCPNISSIIIEMCFFNAYVKQINYLIWFPLCSILQCLVISKFQMCNVDAILNRKLYNLKSEFDGLHHPIV